LGIRQALWGCQLLGVTSGGHTRRVPASAEERLAGLSQSYLFEGWALEELRPLAAVATTRELVRGEHVWHASDHAAELYVVLRSRRWTTCSTAPRRTACATTYRGGYTAELGDEIIAVALDHGARLPSPMSQIHFHQMGGAAGRAGTGASAFSGRPAGYTYNLILTWTDPAQDATHIDANRALAAALAPHSMGGTYVNFTTEADTDRIRATYGDEIYDRLARLKRHYDPANLPQPNIRSAH